MDVPHKVFNKWCEWCARHGSFIPFEKWTLFTLSSSDGLFEVMDYANRLAEDDEWADQVYLVRLKSTGEFYRGEKRRHGNVQRTAWTSEPRKAKFYWQRLQVERLFEDNFPKGEVPEYEVVRFVLVELRGEPK